MIEIIISQYGDNRTIKRSRLVKLDELEAHDLAEKAITDILNILCSLGLYPRGGADDFIREVKNDRQAT